MEKDTLKMITNHMKESGISFTTYSAMHEESMQNPEFRELYGANRSEFEARCAEIDARIQRKIPDSSRIGFGAIMRPAT